MLHQNELKEIRSRSNLEAQKMGFYINDALPLLEVSGAFRSVDEMNDRILCLTAVTATAWGYSAIEAIRWIKQEDVQHALANSEKEFLGGVKSNADFRSRVEALWALLWCAGLTGELDFSTECDENMVTLLPDLRINEPSITFRNRVKQRNFKEVIEKCDLSYCLHWAIRDASLRGKRPPGALHPFRIVERRHALEWMISSEGWDDVPMDT